MLIVLISISSCKKEEVSGVVFSVSVDIIYRDVNNVDLLDPAAPGIYKAGDIDTYWLTNTGEKRRVYTANLTYPEMFSVSNQGYGYVMTVF